MEKLKLKVAELKAAEVLEREELKQVLSGVKAGSGSGSGSGKGSDSGSGSKPGSGSGSGTKPCDGKKEGDGCSFIGSNGQLKYGKCERNVGYLWCHSRGI